MRESIGNQGLIGERIDTIKLYWHSPHCDDLRGLAERVVNVAHAVLPEMLPKRYRRQATMRWMTFKRERQAQFCDVTADNGDAL